jgi:hypothetical protein
MNGQSWRGDASFRAATRRRPRAILASNEAAASSITRHGRAAGSAEFLLFAVSPFAASPSIRVLHDEDCYCG